MLTSRFAVCFWILINLVWLLWLLWLRMWVEVNSSYLDSNWRVKFFLKQFRVCIGFVCLGFFKLVYPFVHPMVGFWSLVLFWSKWKLARELAQFDWWMTIRVDCPAGFRYIAHCRATRIEGGLNPGAGKRLAGGVLRSWDKVRLCHPKGCDLLISYQRFFVENTSCIWKKWYLLYFEKQ